MIWRRAGLSLAAGPHPEGAGTRQYPFLVQILPCYAPFIQGTVTHGWCRLVLSRLVRANERACSFFLWQRKTCDHNNNTTSTEAPIPANSTYRYQRGHIITERGLRTRSGYMAWTDWPARASVGIVF